MSISSQAWRRITGLLGASRFQTLFSGTWEERLADLFDCGVDFAGKRVLDAGSNMGIVAYEINKRRPAFIHGIDNYRPAVTIARRLFMAVDVPHRFDLVDVLDERRIRAVLEPAYDIVLMMALWQHIRRANPEKATRFLGVVTAACREAIIFRGSERIAAHFEEAVAPAGFTVAYRGPRLIQDAGPILVFRRIPQAS